jgi:3-deoxy-D-manno-octulosonate 8-phosphate phosphatase KdsC-like HAD superfamily phosphatase
MSEAPPREGWHLKKEIQVTHLISTAVIAVSAILYVGDIKRDVEVLKARSDERDKASDEAFRQLREDVKTINAKLDRLIESRGK